MSDRTIFVALLIAIGGAVLTGIYWGCSSLGWITGGPPLVTAADFLNVFGCCAAGVAMFLLIGSVLLMCIGLDPFEEPPA